MKNYVAESIPSHERYAEISRFWFWRYTIQKIIKDVLCLTRKGKKKVTSYYTTGNWLKISRITNEKNPVTPGTYPAEQHCNA